MARTLLLIAAGLALLGSLGCAHVQPYERENLARMDRYADQVSTARAYDAHFWMVREGTAGGTGEPGGGCGCN